MGIRLLSIKKVMAELAVNYFTNLFCFAGSTSDLSYVDEVIPALVTSSMNNILTILPSNEEIQNAVFNLNKNSTSGPDEFGGIFYHTYWNLIKDDVCVAVI
ncbi:unnamed protein product [Vicia faba]|uniref:Reverse transcriptase n=1 Tax=Vicia faba TaxID=3906 RepID=A0AAV0ZHW5_VICFA|nr:unnamed protein product [Vicia faba]